MRFFVNLKQYNTERSEEICKGNLVIREKTLNKYVDINPYGTLYRTQKGSYFFVYSYEMGKHRMKILSTDEAKNFVAENNYNRYVTLFGEMEEG